MMSAFDDMDDTMRYAHMRPVLMYNDPPGSDPVVRKRAGPDPRQLAILTETPGAGVRIREAFEARLQRQVKRGDVKGAAATRSALQLIHTVVKMPPAL